MYTKSVYNFSDPTTQQLSFAMLYYFWLLNDHFCTGHCVRLVHNYTQTRYCHMRALQQKILITEFDSLFAEGGGTMWAITQSVG